MDRLSHPKIKILSHEKRFTGYRTVEDLTVSFQSPHSQKWSPPLTREIIRYNAVAAVLLYHAESDQVILSQELRLGPFLRGIDDPWLYECAGGMIDAGEEPHQTALREAFEETGCTITALEPIGHFYPSAGSSDEIFYLFLGHIDKLITGQFGLADEGEEITTSLFKAAEAITLLDQGKIVHMPAALMLSWFARHHARLKNTQHR
jgi:ADP-ribose pyrophosphatase